MSTLNKVMLIGRLGKDPELRFTASGRAVCTMSVATEESWVADGGEKKKITDWHRVVVWGKVGEAAAAHLKKGRLAYFEGLLRTRSYDDKEGVKRYSTEIVARMVTFLPSGQREDRGDPGPRDEGETLQGQQTAEDDDIPF